MTVVGPRLPSMVRAIASGRKSCWARDWTCGRGDGVDLGDDLVDGEEAAEVHLLAGEVGHAAGGALKAEDDVGLELIFGALQLCLRDGFFFETAQLGEGKLQDFSDLVGGGAGVDGRGSRCRGRGWFRSRWSRRGRGPRGWSGRGASSCRRRAWSSAGRRRSGRANRPAGQGRRGRAGPARATSCV